MVQRSASRDAFVSKISDCLKARAALQALEYRVAEDFEQVQRDLLECRVQSDSLQEEFEHELEHFQNELPGLSYFFEGMSLARTSWGRCQRPNLGPQSA